MRTLPMPCPLEDPRVRELVARVADGMRVPVAVDAVTACAFYAGLIMYSPAEEWANVTPLGRKWLAGEAKVELGRASTMVSFHKRLQRALEAYRNGERIEDVARINCISVTTLRERAQETRYNRTPEAIKSAVVTDYLADVPISEIASRHNVSKANIMTIVRDAGIVTRRTFATDEQRAEVKERYLAGELRSEIARVVGLSHEVVSNIVAGMETSS